jgi:PEGA domain-containing protein
MVPPGGWSIRSRGGSSMYRVLAIIGGALALAGCSSTSEFGDVFKSGPVMDTVRLESEPPGADAKVSNGQTCKTPCALALPVDQPLTVTFSLPGYESQAEQLEVVNVVGTPPGLRPNPVIAQLTAAPSKPEAKKKKPARKPSAKKPVAKKPAAKPVAAKPAPAPAAAVAPAPAAPAPTFAPPPPASSSPWPAPPPPQR